MIFGWNIYSYSIIMVTVFDVIFNFEYKSQAHTEDTRTSHTPAPPHIRFSFSFFFALQLNAHFGLIVSGMARRAHTSDR